MVCVVFAELDEFEVLFVLVAVELVKVVLAGFVEFEVLFVLVAVELVCVILYVESFFWRG